MPRQDYIITTIYFLLYSPIYVMSKSGIFILHLRFFRQPFNITKDKIIKRLYVRLSIYSKYKTQQKKVNLMYMYFTGSIPTNFFYYNEMVFSSRSTTHPITTFSCNCVILFYRKRFH